MSIRSERMFRDLATGDIQGVHCTSMSHMDPGGLQDGDARGATGIESPVEEHKKSTSEDQGRVEYSEGRLRTWKVLTCQQRHGSGVS